MRGCILADHNCASTHDNGMDAVLQPMLFMSLHVNLQPSGKPITGVFRSIPHNSVAGKMMCGMACPAYFFLLEHR